MTLGPNLQQNQFFKILKQSAKEWVQQDILSFYTASNGKQILMQVGGVEQSNAQGHEEGVLFYEKTLDKDGNNWILPVNKLHIAKQTSNKWDSYGIPNSNIAMKLSLESKFIILPQRMKQDLQSNFETNNIECSLKSQLECKDISSIDQALTYLSIQLEASAFLNISLYDLRDSFNQKQKIMSYYLKVGKQQDIQLGSVILRPYYISLNLQKSSFLFSPINHYGPDITTTSVLRFLIGMVMFMIFACVVLAVWIQFNDPNFRKKVRYDGKEGIKLVSYKKAKQDDDEEWDD